MSAYLLAGAVLATGLVTWLAVRWYYRTREGAQAETLARAKGEGEALKVERADRSAAEEARNTALEGRWQAEKGEARVQTDPAVVFSRWGRRLRYRSLRRP